jgi:hypothetical protein
METYSQTGWGRRGTEQPSRGIACRKDSARILDAISSPVKPRARVRESRATTSHSARLAISPAIRSKNFRGPPASANSACICDFGASRPTQRQKEFGALVAFMASERAAFLNGVALAYDGGASRSLL